MRYHHSSISSQAYKGWALPAALATLALLTSCVQLMGLTVRGSIRALSATRSGDSFRDQVRQQLFESIPLKSGCSTVETIVNGQRSLYQTCSEGSTPFVTKPPHYPLPDERIDYEGIFSRFSFCRGERRGASGSVFRAPVSQTDCILGGPVPAETVLLDNILATSLQVSDGGKVATIVATPGRLQIKETLLLAHDLLIIAGGDIEIASVVSSAREPVRVSAISSLGEVRIAKLTGGISLLAAGRALLEVPESAPAPSYPLPPFRPVSLYGFKSLSSGNGAP
jgi:hypothetical protein